MDEDMDNVEETEAIAAELIRQLKERQESCQET
jgi:hypothetical protein